MNKQFYDERKNSDFWICLIPAFEKKDGEIFWGQERRIMTRLLVKSKSICKMMK
jgi:hypothetical protein